MTDGNFFYCLSTFNNSFIFKMDLIRNYQDEGDKDSNSSTENEPLPQPVLKKMHVDVAPSVSEVKKVF